MQLDLSHNKSGIALVVATQSEIIWCRLLVQTYKWQFDDLSCSDKAGFSNTNL